MAEATEIPIGPRTRAQAGRLLEQAMAGVWVAILEHRGPEGVGDWEVVVDGLRLVKKRSPEAPPPDGLPAVPEGAALPPARER